MRDIKSPKKKTTVYTIEQYFNAFVSELSKQTQSFLKIIFEKFCEQTFTKVHGGNAKLLWPKYRFSSHFILFPSKFCVLFKSFKTFWEIVKALIANKISQGMQKFWAQNISYASTCQNHIANSRLNSTPTERKKLIRRILLNLTSYKESLFEPCTV